VAPAVSGTPRDSAPNATGQGELARDAALALVEALLLAADEPLTIRGLAQGVGQTDASEVKRLVKRLQELYDRDGTAFQVEEVAGGYHLLTRPEYYSWLVRQSPDQGGGGADRGVRLSTAARETLAIIAYRQPITRADLEGVRGVGCSEVLQQLMEKGFIRIVGRDDSLGRPMLYGTTKKFLRLFGLRTLRDLSATEEGNHETHE
jgi:segregation and condensation protein B